MSIKKDPTVLAETAAVTDQALKELSPYNESNEKKKDKSAKKQDKSSGNTTLSRLRRELESTKNELSALKAEQRKRREYTPTMFIGDDKISLQYRGQVAGVETVRDVIVTRSPAIGKLKPILVPLVSILNAAVHNRSLEELRLSRSEVVIKDGKKVNQKLALKDSDGKPIYGATALTRARWSYGHLLQNDKLVKLLTDVDKQIQNVMKDVLPAKDLKTILVRSDDPGFLGAIPNPEPDMGPVLSLDETPQNVQGIEPEDDSDLATPK